MLPLTREEIHNRIQDSYELPNHVLDAVPKPLVTVRTSTFQHGPYIKECIEGVLMQKTNFPFEFIIGEDFSTDGTREIVFDYATRFPDIIRVITADYNVGGKTNGRRCYLAARGKYMAVCEGDDYWIDPFKLQKQVDMLEADNTISLVHTGYLVKNELKNTFTEHQKRIENIKEDENYNYVHTGDARMLTCMFRLCFLPEIYKILGYKELAKNPIGDRALFLILTSFGKVVYLNDVTGVYRLHGFSSATRFSSPQKKYIFGINSVKTDIFLIKKLKFPYPALLLKKRMFLLRQEIIYCFLKVPLLDRIYKFVYNRMSKDYSDSGFY